MLRIGRPPHGDAGYRRPFSLPVTAGALLMHATGWAPPEMAVVSHGKTAFSHMAALGRGKCMKAWLFWLENSKKRVVSP